MFYPPMLLETAPGPFYSSDFIFEPKYDGIRVQFSNIYKPILYTRNGSIINTQFPELLDSLSKNVVIDGELIGLTKEGKEDFEGVMKRFRMRKKEKIADHITLNPISYKVFDILYYEGQDLRNKILLERKDLLEDIIVENNIVNIVPHIIADGINYFEHVKKFGLEGMVAKKLSSPYLGKRSSYWLKVINWLETDAIISGYRKKDNALLCSHKDGTTLGLVLNGISTNQREALLKVAKQLIHREDSEYFYLQPLLKCKLKGRGFLSNGILRSPSFIDFIL